MVQLQTGYYSLFEVWIGKEKEGKKVVRFNMFWAGFELTCICFGTRLRLAGPDNYFKYACSAVPVCWFLYCFNALALKYHIIRKIYHDYRAELSEGIPTMSSVEHVDVMQAELYPTTGRDDGGR